MGSTVQMGATKLISSGCQGRAVVALNVLITFAKADVLTDIGAFALKKKWLSCKLKVR